MKNRKITGYNNYSVSDCGVVVNDVTGKTLTPIKTKKGYQKVRLYSDGKWKQFFIHRLIAMAFPEVCGEYKDGLQVDHINTIRDDNRAINIRWCNPSENRCNTLTQEHWLDSNSGEKSYWKGKNHTEEAKRKMSESHKGKTSYWNGKTLSDECKRKKSDAMKGKHWKVENGVRVWF